MSSPRRVAVAVVRVSTPPPLRLAADPMSPPVTGTAVLAQQPTPTAPDPEPPTLAPPESGPPLALVARVLPPQGFSPRAVQRKQSFPRGAGEDYRGGGGGGAAAADADAHDGLLATDAPLAEGAEEAARQKRQRGDASGEEEDSDPDPPQEESKDIGLFQDEAPPAAVAAVPAAAAAAAAPAAVPAKKRGRRAPSASWGGAERRSLETLNDLEAGAELLQLLSRGGEMTGGGQAAQASLVHSPLFTFSSRGGQGEALCLLIHAERSLPLARSRAFHVGWQGESPAPPYARGGAYVFSLHALAVRGLL